MAKRDWQDILEHAANIVNSYSTSVTLRQLFYRLVAQQILRNTKSEYGQLSARSAQARREGWFPTLIDQTRQIERANPLFTSTDEAKSWLKERYLRDRTEGQEYSIYLGVEKAGIVEQLWSWFGYQYGFPIVALRGYSSQSFCDNVRDDIYEWPANQVDGSESYRESVFIYAGDFDPSGEDIDRDFLGRVGAFDHYVRVALSSELVLEHDLPPAMGKATDSRASSFMAKHGELVQVELDALPPDTLRQLYQDAIGGYWDPEPWEAAIALEKEERDSL